MSHLRRHCLLITGIIITVMGWAFATAVHAEVQYQFKLLHGFNESLTDGNGPEGPVVFDHESNLYGATFGGGANTAGTVYELTPGSDGKWIESILYSFCSELPTCTDGIGPTGVIIGGAGNLYGTTTAGGINNFGTVFELTPGANGQWTETVLYNFCSLPLCADGASPGYPPTLGPGGVLYGAAGDHVFKLMPISGGWALTTLYTFCSLPNCADGNITFGGVVLDAKGNLYGETLEGGTTDGGVVFGLHPQVGGQWEEVVLHDFDVGDPSQGYDDSGGVTLHDHALFGATQAGGDSGCNEAGCGTLFELTRGAGKTTNEQVLHDFGPSGAEGVNPIETVVFDQRGDLFGVTVEGGSPTCGCGTVYGMKPQGNGKWGFAVLHSFVGSDGATPDATPTLDSKGNLYGITGTGGPGEGGVVFELSPTTQASK